ncbi:Protein of unknown function [Cotesia congregata]|uniref:Uncharacterized protein n=1 Tax=Cotesia congregata TaxID=51543 RepID=A0A8J2MLT0_COTCN|nr:Protein of unknown function [Cotesia congregata]
MIGVCDSIPRLLPPSTSSSSISSLSQFPVPGHSPLPLPLSSITIAVEVVVVITVSSIAPGDDDSRLDGSVQISKVISVDASPHRRHQEITRHIAVFN